MKAWRMRRPSGVRIGMFCRFGSVEDSRPVAATAWWDDVWIRPVRGVGCAAGGADGDVLQVRVRRGQPAGGGDRLVVRRVDPAGARVDLRGERVGIGAAQ